MCRVLLHRGRLSRLVLLLLGRLCGLRRLRSTHNPVVMLGMLEIIFRHDPVASRARITRKLLVLFIDVRRRPTNFDLWPRRIKCPVGVVVIVVLVVLWPAATTSGTFHEIPFLVIKRSVRKCALFQNSNFCRASRHVRKLQHQCATHLQCAEFVFRVVQGLAPMRLRYPRSDPLIQNFLAPSVVRPLRASPLVNLSGHLPLSNCFFAFGLLVPQDKTALDSRHIWSYMARFQPCPSHDLLYCDRLPHAHFDECIPFWGQMIRDVGRQCTVTGQPICPPKKSQAGFVVFTSGAKVAIPALSIYGGLVNITSNFGHIVRPTPSVNAASATLFICAFCRAQCNACSEISMPTPVAWGMRTEMRSGCIRFRAQIPCAKRAL